MGMRIPNVPQDVPVENAMKQAATKMIAGRKMLRPCAFARAVLTNVSESRRPVIFLRLVAIVRMRIAGTIAKKPFVMHSIASLKETRRLAMKYTIVKIRATRPPQGRPTVASVLENASIKLRELS